MWSEAGRQNRLADGKEAVDRDTGRASRGAGHQQMLQGIKPDERSSPVFLNDNANDASF